jgi:hypothetical protein
VSAPKPTADVREAVLTRDMRLCQWCGRGVDPSSGDYSLQHRRARGTGGSVADDTNTAANLLTMCGSATTGCHGHVESHPNDARARGFRLFQWQAPDTVPALLWTGDWYYLDPIGLLTPTPAPAAELYMRSLGLITKD